MSDVTTFIDAIGKDVGATVGPKIDALAHEIHAKVSSYGPRVSEFAEALVKDIIAEQSVTVRNFVTGVIADLCQRYRPELAGELQTHIVQGGLHVTGQGVRLDLKNRQTGATVSSLDLPVDITIKVDSVGVDRKSTRLNSSHIQKSRMPSSA